MNPPIELGGRLELFVDDALIEDLSGGARLELHRPTPREPALVTGEPWEGSMCNYITVFRDGDRCRMYYKAHGIDLSHRDEGARRAPGTHPPSLQGADP